MSDIAELFNDNEESNDSEVELNETESQEKVEENTEETEISDEAKDSQDDEKQDSSEEETTADEQKEWTFAAVKDERRKRQEAEDRLKDLESKLNTLKAAKDEKLPDVFEDQEAFAKSLQDQFKTEMRQRTIDMQRDMMIEFKPDYEDKEKAFFEVAKNNPVLISEANNSSNPAKFAYEQGEKYLKYKDIQNVESLESKLRADLEAKIKQELEQKYKEKESKASNLTPSLAKARGTTDKDPSLPENPIDLFG